MIEDELFSRPARLAAQVRAEADEAAKHLFIEKHILLRLEEAFVDVPDARETLLFALNQALRFCPNIAVCIPRSANSLIDASDELAARVHGPSHRVEVVEVSAAPRFDAVVNVGTEVLEGLPWITINSSGWLARVATGGSRTKRLHWEPHPFNPIGALAATCLGVAGAFFGIIGKPVVQALELSLFSHEVGAPRTLAAGPALPEAPLGLEAFLVGCGAVANGWAYAVKRLPIVGKLQGVDRQSLRLENLGSYVAAGRESLRNPKADVIRDLLSPAIALTPRAEEWELFKIRLRHGIPVPALIVNGLDDVETRHSAQRLWPDTLIDMAAGGLMSQVIVKHRTNNGLCLLRAVTPSVNRISWAERLARQTGLRVERILNEPTSEITQADIDVAPPDKRPALERARQQGQLVCGRVTEQNLKLEGHDPDFAPAVPFVTAFSGVVGAAETLKYLMAHRYRHSLHYQRSFQSGRSRVLEMTCHPECECQTSKDRGGDSSWQHRRTDSQRS